MKPIHTPDGRSTDGIERLLHTWPGHRDSRIDKKPSIRSGEKAHVPAQTLVEE